MHANNLTTLDDCAATIHAANDRMAGHYHEWLQTVAPELRAAQEELATHKAGFGHWCQDEFGWTATHARRLIAAHDAFELLNEPVGSLRVPPTQNERQLRELLVVPRDDLTAVWSTIAADAEESGKMVTAGLIRQHVRRLTADSDDAPATPTMPQTAEPVPGPLPVAEDPMTEIRRLASQLGPEQWAELAALAAELSPTVDEESDETILAGMEADYRRLGSDAQIGIFRTVAHWPAPRDEFFGHVRALLRELDPDATFDYDDGPLPSDECMRGLTAVLNHLFLMSWSPAAEERFVEAICATESIGFSAGAIISELWLVSDTDHSCIIDSFSSALPAIAEMISAIPKARDYREEIRRNVVDVVAAGWPCLAKRDIFDLTYGDRKAVVEAATGIGVTQPAINMPIVTIADLARHLTKEIPEGHHFYDTFREFLGHVQKFMRDNDVAYAAHLAAEAQKEAAVKPTPEPDPAMENPEASGQAPEPIQQQLFDTSAPYE